MCVISCVIKPQKYPSSKQARDTMNNAGAPTGAHPILHTTVQHKKTSTELLSLLSLTAFVDNNAYQLFCVRMCDGVTADNVADFCLSVDKMKTKTAAALGSK